MRIKAKKLIAAQLYQFLYMDNNELFNSVKIEFINNNKLQIALVILIISKLFFN